MQSRLTAVAGVVALAFPAGALAQRPAATNHGSSHGKSTRQHATTGQHGKAGEHGKAGQPHGKGKGHGHVPTVALVAHGSVVSVDTAGNTAVVQVTQANHHGGALVGTQVTVDLSKAVISVADVNGDGQQNLADVAAGDQVVVQGSIPLHGSLSGPLTARRLVDQTHPATGDSSGSTQTGTGDSSGSTQTGTGDSSGSTQTGTGDSSGSTQTGTGDSSGSTQPPVSDS